MNVQSKARLRRAALVLAAASATALVHSCGGSGGEADTRYACSYEKRVSQTCNRTDYGAWTRGCSAFDADNYTITPQQVCQNITSGGLHCASSCCIDSQFRSVSLAGGTC